MCHSDVKWSFLALYVRRIYSKHPLVTATRCPYGFACSTRLTAYRVGESGAP